MTKTTILGAMLAAGLLLAATAPGRAGPGDGLDRNALSQGNSNMGGMHTFTRQDAQRQRTRRRRARPQR